MRENPSAQELVALGEQIAEQAVHLDAAMHRLLIDLRRFDEAGGWLAQGFTSCAHWLSHRVGWDLATAREHLRVARALAALPEVGAALASGKLSYSKVRAISRVATPANEPILLKYAEVSTASQLETICRKLRAAERMAADPRQALPRDDDRYVSASSTASGLVCVKAFLLPDEAALVMQAIGQAARAGKALPDQDGAEPSSASRGSSGEPSDVSAGDSADHSDFSAQLPTDPSGVSAGGLAARASHSTDRTLNRADGLMALVHAYARGGNPHRSPIEMIITTPAETLRGSAESHAALQVPPATSAHTILADPHDRGASIPVAIVAGSNTYLPVDTARRLACDCGLVGATIDRQGRPLSVGRKTRTIPAAIKRALLLRDRTCRFPGCDHRLFLDGHHLQHWADGGETSIGSLTLLCSAHHARVHEHHYRIVATSSGELTFFDSRGHRVVAVPPRPAPPDLGWPAIRASNAVSCPLPLSAETSVDVGRHGQLDHKEAVGRLLKLSQRAPIQANHAPVQTEAHLPSPPSDDARRRDDDLEDLDHDFVAAGHRADDLLEWSMDELRDTGIDPMATVPAPIWPPPSWYENKQRAVPAPARRPSAPRRGRPSRERSPELTL